MKEKNGKMENCGERRTAEVPFAQVARRVRRRRFIMALGLMVLAGLLTLVIVNYKTAQSQIKPMVVLGKEGQNNGQTITRIYYSLGFKQVYYKSQYGRNYCERKWLWEEVEKNPDVLTGEQYQQLMELLTDQYRQTPVYEDYFNTFQTFEAIILDVEKQGNQYTIYLNGRQHSFLEYQNRIYTDADGSPQTFADAPAADTPLIVAASWDGKKMEIEKIKTYELGDADSADIFRDFPKAAAMRMLMSIDGEEDSGEILAQRAKLKAAAYFGKSFAEDTYLSLDEETGLLEVYKAVPDKYFSDEESDPQDNDPLVKRDKLRKVKKK